MLRKHKPVAAFGVGGYAAGPMMLATWMRGVPNMIFEPNAEPGFTNRVLARISTRIAAGYERFRAGLGAEGSRHRLPGARGIFCHQRRARPEKPFRLLVTGGSQGALAINRTFVDAMDRLADAKERTAPSCIRPANATIMRYVPRTRGANYQRRLCPFSRNMAERFAWADMIVCRAGAITAAEIAAAGRAAIFIPFGPPPTAINCATLRRWRAPAQAA